MCAKKKPGNGEGNGILSLLRKRSKRSRGSIRIETTKILDPINVMTRRIDELKGFFYFGQLPQRYLNGKHMYVNSSGKVIMYRDPKRRGRAVKLLEVGKFYYENVFQKKRMTIEYCGDRLHQINRSEKIRKIRETWSGSETVKI